MSDTRERNCVNCMHWYFNAGEPDYSELTPGTEWQSSCLKGRWYMNGYRVTETEFRKNMRTAQTCVLYQEREP